MISMAKKASTTKSTGMSDPVATRLKASSNGDAHAEYTTNTTRKVCQILQNHQLGQVNLIMVLLDTIPELD